MEVCDYCSGFNVELVIELKVFIDGVQVIFYRVGGPKIAASILITYPGPPSSDRIVEQRMVANPHSTNFKHSLQGEQSMNMPSRLFVGPSVTGHT